jgi:hypothetical protein
LTEQRDQSGVSFTQPAGAFERFDEDALTSVELDIDRVAGIVL